MAKAAKVMEFRESREALESICKATDRKLSEENNIHVGNDAVVATIAYEFLYQSFMWLNANKKADEEVVINFGQLMELGVTNREGGDEEEKDGNFVPFLNAGHIAKTIIKSDLETEDED